jgi:hypothetical protein
MLFEICSLQECDIEEVSLMYGTATSEVSPEWKFPPKLRQIAITDTGWEGDTFRNFLNVCQGSDRISLNLVGTHLLDEQWADVDNFLGTFTYDKLTNFIFDENPIGPGLIKWIGRNLHLKEISFQDCQFEDQSLGDILYELLKSSTSIRQLRLKGSRNCTFASVLPRILAGVIENKSLEELNIEDNHAGDGILEPLRVIIANHPAIRIIRFEGNDYGDYRPIIELSELVKQRTHPILLCYPSRDIENLRKQARMSDADVIRTQTICRDSRKPFRPSYDTSFITEMTTKDTNGGIPDFDLRLIEPSAIPCQIPQFGALIDGLNEEYVSDAKWQKDFGTVPAVDIDQFVDSALAQFECRRLVDALN